MFALMLAAALSQQTPAPEWQRVYRDETGEVFIDAASVRRTDAMVVLASRAVFAGKQPSGLSSAIIEMHVNCARRTLARVRTRTFDNRGLLILDAPMTGIRAAPQPVTPRTANEAIFLRVCPATRSIA